MSIATIPNKSTATNHAPSTAHVACIDRSIPIQRAPQILVRFELLHRTLMVPAPPPSSRTTQGDSISMEEYMKKAIVHALRRLVIHRDDDPLVEVLQNHCRPADLRLTQWNPPFAACAFTRALRGGKGGFGTLLKGQSRQSSAHTTKHFHDCRNLQGQRLRAVNEQLHYQVWKEWHDKVQAGTATEAELLAALTNTPTGLAGWHLALPSWAEVSVKKEQQLNQKLLRRWRQEQAQRQEQQQRQRERSEQQITAYVQTAHQVQEQLERTMAAALQEGLRKQHEKQPRARTEPVSKRARTEMMALHNTAEHVETTAAPLPPFALVTLSGEASVTPSDDVDATTAWTIQGLSNFCTVGILLDASQYHTTFESRNDVEAMLLLYYEVVLRSGTGVAQIGWARPGGIFQPNSDTGDGVGDGATSWGYDPSRSIKLHAGISELYGIDGESTTPDSNSNPTQDDIRGAVVGCGWNVRTGEVFFSVNGQHLGTAFSVPAPEEVMVPSLYPVLSCNEGETVQIRLYGKEMAYCPPTAVPVGDILLVEDAHQNGSMVEKDDQGDMDRKPKAVESALPLPVTDAPTNAGPENRPLTAPSESAELPPLPEEEPLDLRQFSSAQELEALGRDRLKRALMAAGLKCGGTLTEQAVRLFAIRDLDPPDYPMKLRAAKISS
jgi:Replication stress response SDE2 C-terminal/SPRY domain/Silencing defective 2 N-terminal ubiquitin domain